jgi:transcriptional regulator with XRE-family HTH domain
MPTPARDRVAGNIRAEMARNRLTQSDLAVVLGKSQQSVSKKLRGRIPFDLDEIETLAQHFGIPIEQIVKDPVGVNGELGSVAAS